MSARRKLLVASEVCIRVSKFTQLKTLAVTVGEVIKKYWGAYKMLEIMTYTSIIIILLIHIINWKFAYRTYVIRGKHFYGKDIIRVIRANSEEKAVNCFREFHDGTEVYSVEDTDQNGLNEQ